MSNLTIDSYLMSIARARQDLGAPHQKRQVRFFRSSPDTWVLQLRDFESLRSGSTGKSFMLATAYLSRDDLVEIRDAIQGEIAEIQRLVDCDCACTEDVPCDEHVVSVSDAILDTPEARSADLASIPGELDMVGPDSGRPEWTIPCPLCGASESQKLDAMLESIRELTGQLQEMQGWRQALDTSEYTIRKLTTERNDLRARLAESGITAESQIVTCVDHWHCDPFAASHICDRPIRTRPCPTCGQRST